MYAAYTTLHTKHYDVEICIEWGGGMNTACAYAMLREWLMS